MKTHCALLECYEPRESLREGRREFKVVLLITKEPSTMGKLLGRKRKYETQIFTGSGNGEWRESKTGERPDEALEKKISELADPCIKKPWRRRG